MNTKTTLMSAVLLSSTLLAGCAGTQRLAHEAVAPGKIGGAYMVVAGPALAAHEGQPAVAADVFGPDQFDDLAVQEESCRTQLSPYIPSVFKDAAGYVAKQTLATAIGTGLGTGAGAIAAFTGVAFKQYAEYGGLSGGGSMLGSSLVSAGDREHLATAYVMFACQQFMTTRAQGYGHLQGVGIIPWIGYGNAKGYSRPDGASVAPASQPVPTGHRSQQVPPPLP